MVKASMNPARLAAALVLAAAAGWGIAGCGGTECGDQTMDEDGTCVPETEVICGEGTMPQDGECVVGDDGCGENTTYNSDTGQCEPADGVGPCGPGSMFDSEAGQCMPAAEACGTNATFNEESGKCEPDLEAVCANMGAVSPAEDGETCKVDSGACGDGTKLSMNGDCVVADGACGPGTARNDDGQCVPSAEACDDGTMFVEEEGLCLPEATCQVGDVVLDGKCVSPAEELADEPDTEGSENDDPEQGGEANTIPVKAPGETTSFTGTIGAPKDLNDDDSPEQDVDVFEFEAEEGQWFEVAVQSLGLSAPFFTIEGPDDFERRSAFATQASPIREIAIPEDGKYRIRVMPRTNFIQDIGPEGGDDWNYVGSLEQIETPDPSTVDMTQNAISGDYRTLTDNLFQIDGFSGGQVVEFTLASGGGDVSAPLISRWSDGSTHESTGDADFIDGSRAVVPSGSSSGLPLLLFDWTGIGGPDTEFELEAEAVTVDQQVGDLGMGSENSTNAVSLPSDGDTALFTFNIPAGQAVEFSQENAATADVDMELFGSSGETLSDALDVSPTNGEDNPSYMYYYSETGGTLALEVEATEDNIDDVVVDMRTFAPGELGSGKPGDDPLTASSSSTLGPNQSALYTMTLDEKATVEPRVTTDSAADFSVQLRDESFGELGDDAEGTGTTELSTSIYETGDAGLKLVQVTAGEEIASHDVEVTLSAPAVTDSEPNNDQSSAQEGRLGTVHLGETKFGNPDFFEFSPSSALSPGEVVYVRPQSTTFFSYSCELIDSQGNTVDSVTDREGGCVLASDQLSSGPFYLKVEGPEPSFGRAFPVDYSLKVSRIPGAASSDGNNDQSNADSVGYDTLTTDDGHYYGRLSDNDGTDWFNFDVPSGGLESNQSLKLVPEITAAEPAPRSAMSATLIDASGQSDSTLDTQSFQTVVSGDALSAQTYFVQVQLGEDGLGFDEQGDYRLGAEVVRSFSQSVSGGSFSDGSNNTASSQITPSACSGSSVTDVAVEVEVDHPVEEEVKLVLEAPDGTSVTLQDSTGSSSDAFPSPIAYPWTAETAGDLSNLSGKSGTSAWTLTVSDTAGSNSDTGTLNSWTLNFKCN